MQQRRCLCGHREVLKSEPHSARDSVAIARATSLAMPAIDARGVSNAACHNKPSYDTWYTAVTAGGCSEDSRAEKSSTRTSRLSSDE